MKVRWWAVLVMLLGLMLAASIGCGDDDDDTVADDDDDDNNDDNDDDDDDDDNDTVFYDPDRHLCEEWNANPEDLDDPVGIDCLIEKGEFAPVGLPVPDVLRVVDWNIERGLKLDDYLVQFQSDPTLVEADILLLQEVDRHCTRTGYRPVAYELAEALEMDYVYGVEFVELNQERGEHGNAILSRYPIVATRLLRHTDFERWYEDDGQPRLGGRMSIRADVVVGSAVLRLGSVHYTSGVLQYFEAHQTQAQETLDWLTTPDAPVIWGGDLNTGINWVLGFEPSISLILAGGYDDALADLPREENWTMPGDPPIPRMRLDWIFHRGLPTLGGRVLYEAPLNDLSDHLGIYADFVWP